VKIELSSGVPKSVFLSKQISPGNTIFWNFFYTGTIMLVLSVPWTHCVFTMALLQGASTQPANIFTQNNILSFLKF
jgi:hypothetical protein